MKGLKVMEDEEKNAMDGVYIGEKEVMWFKEVLTLKGCRCQGVDEECVGE